MKRFLFLVLPQVHMLDLAGPLQMISTLTELGLAPVSVACIGPEPRVPSFQGTWLDDVSPLPHALGASDVLVVIGSKMDDTLTQSPAWRDTVAWLRHAAARAPAVPLCGVCTGSFLLADAGLLDGRVCTTHHSFARRLQTQHPLAHVVENRVLVQDDRILTSAGVASGIDLALHLIAQQFGSHLAVRVARENVVHFRRFGNDPELAPALKYRSHGNQRVHAVQDVLSETLAAGTGIETLANRFGLSPRHLSRLFLAETGVGIKQYQLELRMELARRLVAESTLSLEAVAERCGFASVQAFRANWNKREPVAPSAYRLQHRAAGEPSSASA